MRGQAQMVTQMKARPRITPADAGTSHLPDMRAASRADHPRGCGDKGHIQVEWKFAQGSPPRMRGQGVFPFPLCVLSGITPADAGTSVNPM